MTLARGGCYWPGCGEPTVRFVNGVPMNNFQIAHIRAFSPGGPRYDPDLPAGEREGFSNLLLLCIPHHTLVDGQRTASRYPVELLKKWKSDREADGVEALAGLRDLTESRLPEMIATAQGELLDRVGPALEEFGKSAPELASLLKVVLDELADPRVHGFGVSQDAIEDLASAAHSLRGLEDHAAMLMNAAVTMGNLTDGAAALREAAHDIRGLGTSQGAVEGHPLPSRAAAPPRTSATPPRSCLPPSDRPVPGRPGSHKTVALDSSAIKRSSPLTLPGANARTRATRAVRPRRTARSSAAVLVRWRGENRIVLLIPAKSSSSAETTRATPCTCPPASLVPLISGRRRGCAGNAEEAVPTVAVPSPGCTSPGRGLQAVP